jgi:hypothetical protein
MSPADAFIGCSHAVLATGYDCGNATAVVNTTTNCILPVRNIPPCEWIGPLVVFNEDGLVLRSFWTAVNAGDNAAWPLQYRTLSPSRPSAALPATVGNPCADAWLGVSCRSGRVFGLNLWNRNLLLDRAEDVAILGTLQTLRQLNVGVSGAWTSSHALADQP